MPKDVAIAEDQIWKAIDGLSEDESQILTAHLFEEQSVTDAASQEGVSFSEISLRLGRAGKSVEDSARD